jgi:hypothetical protein
MIDDRSLERAARSFIESGPTRAPEHAVEAALFRIASTSQERGLRVPWRTTMNTPARVAAAAAIGVVAVGGAFFLLGRAGEPNVGGPAASPSPTSSVPASIAAAATPSNVAAPTLPEGPLAPGTYVAAPLASALFNSCMSPPQPGCSESEDDSIRVTFTVPGGWAGLQGYGAIALAAEGTSSPAGASMGIGRGSWLHSDPCLTAARLAADVRPDVVVGPGVDEFASAIADHPLLDATDPVPVTLGGFSGKYVDLQLPTDLTGCATSYYPWEPGIYAQGPGHRWHLWILDVDGIRLLVQTTDYAGTSAQHRAELDAIVQSIQIKP